MARYKEMCLDTTRDDTSLAEFWAAVSGGRVDSSRPPGDVVGEQEQVGIAMCLVPEEKQTVKNRVHLDVYARSVDDLVALGASVVLPAEESGFGWTTMLDPEGNDFCAFVRAESSPELARWRVHGVGIDAADPARVAAWWAEVFGIDVVDHTDAGADWWSLEAAITDPLITLDFAPVPEPKTVKNRMHWDVYGEPAEFLDRGATLLAELPRWTVLADPEGNEFCVFPEPS